MFEWGYSRKPCLKCRKKRIKNGKCLFCGYDSNRITVENKKII